MPCDRMRGANLLSAMSETDRPFSTLMDFLDSTAIFAGLPRDQLAAIACSSLGSKMQNKVSR